MLRHFKKGKEDDPGSYRLVNFTLVIWNITDQVLMEAVSRHIKEKVVGSSQQEFYQGQCFA